jgi:hypothetical protein
LPSGNASAGRIANSPKAISSASASGLRPSDGKPGATANAARRTSALRASLAHVSEPRRWRSADALFCDASLRSRSPAPTGTDVLRVIVSSGFGVRPKVSSGQGFSDFWLNSIYANGNISARWYICLL